MTKPKYVIDATLHLFGDALEPAQISELLGVKASSSWRKGDKLIERSTGKEWPRKYGRWSVSVDTEPDRLDLPSVIDRLIARAGPNGKQ